MKSSQSQAREGSKGVISCQKKTAVRAAKKRYGKACQKKAREALFAEAVRGSLTDGFFPEFSFELDEGMANTTRKVLYGYCSESGKALTNR